MSVRNIWVSLVNQVYGLLGLAHGGTNADLSGTGGTSQVLKQVTAGAAVTVGQLAASDLSNGTTGTGAVVLATLPTLTALNLGASCYIFPSGSDSVAGVVGNLMEINHTGVVSIITINTDGAVGVNGVVSAVSGFQYNGVATSGHVLRGNGTAFIDAQLAAADLSNGTTGTGAVMLANAPGFTAGPTITSSGPLLEFIGTEVSAKSWQIQESGGVLYFTDVTDTYVNALKLTGGTGVGYADVLTAYKTNGTIGVTQTAGAPTSIATMGGIVTTLVVASDERLKDFKPYEGGLDEVLAITPIRYKWNEKGIEIGADGSREFVGFGAHDVQKAIPEAIVGQQVAPDGTEYLGFDDRPVIAAMVNAIKELTARVKELEAKNVTS